jgi:predicted transposase/invertase (TIGR01784 family)
MPSLGGGSQGRQWLWALVWTGRSRATVSRKGSLFAFWVVEARLGLDEQREVKHRLKEIDMPEIMEWFKEEGIAEGIEQGIERGARAKAIEDATKMLEHGIDWRIVTDVTGISPEDLDSKT